jgi:hypothetical protein
MRPIATFSGPEIAQSLSLRELWARVLPIQSVCGFHFSFLTSNLFRISGFEFRI